MKPSLHGIVERECQAIMKPWSTKQTDYSQIDRCLFRDGAGLRRPCSASNSPPTAANPVRTASNISRGIYLGSWLIVIVYRGPKTPHNSTRLLLEMLRNHQNHKLIVYRVGPNEYPYSLEVTLRQHVVRPLHLRRLAVWIAVFLVERKRVSLRQLRPSSAGSRGAWLSWRSWKTTLLSQLGNPGVQPQTHKDTRAHTHRARESPGRNSSRRRFPTPNASQRTRSKQGEGRRRRSV